MLKIKDDKWQEFCNNAESFGYKYQPIFDYPNWFREEYKSYCYFKFISMWIVGIVITKDYIRTDRKSRADSNIEKYLIDDLIQAGLVEKAPNNPQLIYDNVKG